MPHTKQRVIVSTQGLRQVSLIDSGDTLCIELEGADGRAVVVLLPSRSGAALMEGMRSALRDKKAK